VKVPTETRRVRFGAFEADLRSGELHKHGFRIKLQDQPFQLLALLLERPGDVITREELRQKLWPADTFVDFDVGLNTAVKRLRDALGDSAENVRFIETLPRRGYRFIAPVDNGIPVPAQASQLAGPAPVAAEPSTISTHEVGAAATQVAARRSRVKLWVGAIVLAGLLAAMLGLSIGGWRQRLLRAPVAGRIQSIAVLPLENLTGDPAQEYFVDGMTDALITDLAQISSLRVISRTSAMRYKTARKPLPQIAKELNVEALVEGAVVRSGSRVRIDAQLIQASTDGHLWARSYQRELTDIVALQSDVAQAIANEIQIKLTPLEQERLSTNRPVSPEAYEAYLQGRYYWNKRTEEGLKKSLDYFQEAIRRDPGYALAYAGLADSYNLLGRSLAATVPGQEAAPKARAAALKALELDPALGEAHATLGYTKFVFDWDWDGAEKEFQRAIALSPGYASAYHWYSLYLQSIGRSEEAFTAIRRAQQLDPVSPNITKVIATCLADLRRYDEAIEQFHKAIELGPTQYNTHIDLAETYAQMKKFPEAIAEGQKAVELSDGKSIPLASLAITYGLAGKKAEAEKLLDELRRRTQPRPINYAFACICSALGRKDEAFAWLERDFAIHSPDLVLLRTELCFEPLHSDARFKDLVRRIGFPPLNGTGK
jgi:TolB-like protein/DNA-binding winged helix-turn-helix (wHTH) protein/Flp pilus assembly protein TadD